MLIRIACLVAELQNGMISPKLLVEMERKEDADAAKTSSANAEDVEVSKRSTSAFA